MGYISTIFACRALELCCADQPDSAGIQKRLLKASGIKPALLKGRDKMISNADFFLLLELIDKECHSGRSIGFRVGASMRCDDYGAFGLGFKSAIDLGGSFKCVERYGKVVTNVANFSISRSSKSTWMTVPAASTDRLGEIMTTEMALAAATALSREVSGEAFSPVQLSFRHAAPEDDSFATAFFRSPVRFGADRNGIKVDNTSLASENRLGDAKIAEFFAQHLDAELKKRGTAQTLESQVMALVTRSLSQGPPRVEDIAGHLCMSRRTLQRRLADENCAYGDLVDRARRELAKSLLQKRSYGIAEIAFLCGYSDQSTFTRAFRRWEGVTPASYRNSNLTN